MDLEVRRLAPLAGRVTTETGDPLAGATITIDRAWEEDGSHVGGHEEVATDADGRFEIDGFAAGVRVRLVAKASGFAVHFAGPFRVPAEPREFAIALAPERPLVVRVVGTDDEGPVAHAALRGMFGDGEFRPQIAGETDAAGECRLRGWDGRSDLVLDVSRPGYYRARRAVPAGDERTVEVRLRATGHRTVRGRVTRSGRPPGVRVSISARCPADPERPGATAYTDDEGRFELSGLRGGDEYVLEATSAGLSYGEYRSPPVWFRAEEGPDLEIPLVRTGHLAGLAVASDPGKSGAAVHVRIDRILLPDGGEPRPAPWLPEFRPGRFAMRLPPGSPLAAVEIFGWHEDGWFTYLGRTDEAGRRTLRALRPGRWTILGRRKGDRLAVLGEIRVTGRAGTAVEATLAAPGRLVVSGPAGAAFTVRADRPAPLDDLLVAGALRTWWPGSPEPPERVAREPDFAVAAGGRTDVDGLAPGDYVVESGGRSVRVGIRPGETTEVRLPLR